jgi:hypothetical protein
MENIKNSNIEMIMLLKKYKYANNIKIKNIAKMNRLSLIEECSKYKLLNNNNDDKITFDLRLLSKKQLQEDVIIFYLKKGMYIEKINKINKESLIELMTNENIPHITKNDVEKETIAVERYNKAMNIVKYNKIKYDNIPYGDIINIYKLYSIEEIEKYIADNNLNKNTDNMENITELVSNIYNAYKQFCEKSDIEFNAKNTLPSVVNCLSNIL